MNPFPDDEALDRERFRNVRSLAEADPPEANGRIRAGYLTLSDGLGRLLHGNQEPENATFATFAAWTAYSLRHDTMMKASTTGTSTSVGSPDPPVRRPARRLYDEVAGKVLDDPTAIARNIARGQATIFEETGSALHALLEETLKALDDSARRRGPRLDWPVVWERVSNRLIVRSRELNASADRLDVRDVTVLQQALDPYFRVLDEGLSTAKDQPDRKRRAELILLGNLRLVAYEQRRLQPVLEQNLSYLPQALRQRLFGRLSGRPTFVSNAVLRYSPQLMRSLKLLETAFEITATRYVYSMRVGAEDLRFGLDLPLPPPAHPLPIARPSEIDMKRYVEGEFFPAHLQVIESPELWAEWHTHDRSSGQGGQTAVDNWLRLPERMNWIANVFRSRQQLTGLYEPTSWTPTVIEAATPQRLAPAYDRVATSTEARLAQRFGEA